MEVVQPQVQPDLFANDPLFADYGPVKVKREPVRLTEEEFEIGVKVTKYLFEEALVLEFGVESSLENT